MRRVRTDVDEIMDYYEKAHQHCSIPFPPNQALRQQFLNFIPVQSGGELLLTADS